MSVTANDERDIAIMAAGVLRAHFIVAFQQETVLYVENDNLMRKTPGCEPVFVRCLSGRNQKLRNKAISRSGVFKIKKRRTDLD